MAPACRLRSRRRRRGAYATRRGEETRRSGWEPPPGTSLTSGSWHCVANATKRVPSPVLTRNSTALRPSFLASRRDARHLAGGRDRLAAGLEDHVADLQTLLRRGAVRIDIGDDHAALPRAGNRTRRRQASGRNWRAAVARSSVPLVSALGRPCSFGKVPSLTSTVFSRAVVPDQERSASRSGPSAAILRASSRGPSTWLAIDAEDHVARLDPGLRRRRILLRRRRPARPWRSSGRGCRRCPASPAEFATPIQPRVTTPLSFERRDDTCATVGRDGEADADAAARRRIDRRIDADDFALRYRRSGRRNCRGSPAHRSAGSRHRARSRCRGRAPKRCPPSPCRQGRTDCRPRSPNRRRAAASWRS